MKRLLIFFLLLFSLARGEAQTTTTSDRVVTKSLYLRDWWVDSVKRDTNFLGAARSIPTAAAVYNFVAGRGAPGYTSVTALPDSSGLIFHGPNGVQDTVVFEGETSGGGGASLPTLSTLTDGATITWDYSTQGTEAKVTLAGNRTLSITNLPAGEVVYLTLEVIQDATGSRTLTLPASTKVIGGGAGAVTLTTTGGATDLLTFRWNGTTLFANIGTNYN
jgi:hypothetical protein